MVRIYGAPPYRAAVVHGGPGAPGTAGGLALGLSQFCGVLEPLQSRLSLRELLDELTAQLQEFLPVPCVLIGHSFGAWLCAMLTAERPELIRKLILVGCGPLDAAYTGQIGTRRLQNLNPKDAEEFLRLDSLLEGGGGTDADLARLGTLADKADHFQELQIQEPESFPPDSRAYGSLWPEISRLRKSGGLLDVFPKISCPIVLIQGENDPHPPAGVSAPLEHLGIPLRPYLLPRCGHNPWREQYAREPFFRILKQEVLG